jgi:hypothetical protein
MSVIPVFEGVCLGCGEFAVPDHHFDAPEGPAHRVPKQVPDGSCRRGEFPNSPGAGSCGPVIMPWGVKACRTCGCTELSACLDPDTGVPCSWAEPDLCSACVTPIQVRSATS